MDSCKENFCLFPGTLEKAKRTKLLLKRNKPSTICPKPSKNTSAQVSTRGWKEKPGATDLKHLVRDLKETPKKQGLFEGTGETEKGPADFRTGSFCKKPTRRWRASPSSRRRLTKTKKEVPRRNLFRRYERLKEQYLPISRNILSGDGLKPIILVFIKVLYQPSYPDF